MIPFYRAMSLSHITVAVISLSALSSANAGDVKKLSAEILKKWSQTPEIFVGRITQVIPGPIGFSNPPLYTHKLQIAVDKVIRGSVPTNKPLLGSHQARQRNAPTFPQGKICIISAIKMYRRYKDKDQINWQIKTVQVANANSYKEVELAAKLPIGWQLKNGKLLSPWAKMGKNAWPGISETAFVCKATGRPSLLAGQGVSFSAAIVPPKKQVKYGNPDGDGEFKITVTNNTNKPVSVPALLSDGRNILWNESLLIVCQDKVYTCPGAKGVGVKTQPTLLKPGQSVSTVVNALKLQGPNWPRGGYRIVLQFCLGEKSVSRSFYYLSRHHDPIRAKISGK